MTPKRISDIKLMSGIYEYEVLEEMDRLLKQGWEIDGEFMEANHPDCRIYYQVMIKR